ncbi:hypothetical protein CAPTEDRAFT_171114 [Capitella teleta]|uniref:PH domain-containing protein n=1 Tax=Capitella teleta TaxID=283909 RepID=R7VJK1_CAPTE|nr:hypothetical protein CAPTEDRAFT_171114 [Capitella teleta]|eukprot:ELU15980.1 hypothetical protein CAPTEDRAFT_171114 [Capitella teleta]
MPGMEKLHLEDALEDGPQMRSLLGVFEKDAQMLQKYTTDLHKCCERVLDAQKEMSAATYSLSTHLKVYEKQSFPLENDDSILISTLKQFTIYLDELSSIHQVLASQMGDSMLFPLSKFLQADLDEILTMKDVVKSNSSECDNALVRYMRHSKKKDQDKTRYVVNEELAVSRKKYHQSALHHYAALNSLQYKRKTSLLEPLIGYMHAQKAFFDMGRETLATQDLDDFLSNISASVQGVHSEMNEDTQQTVEMVQSLEQQCQYLYHGEPMAEFPFMPPNDTLHQKAGYLFMRNKQMLQTKWERCYFFIQGGNLMCQAKDEVAGRFILDLNEDGITVAPSDTDDRRFVLQINDPFHKKTVILQAENDKEREEWIFTIDNIVKANLIAIAGTDIDGRIFPSCNRSPFFFLFSESSLTGGRSLGGPPTPPSTPAEGGFIPDAPIQFDIISPSEEAKAFPGTKEGPQNQQLASDAATDGDRSAFCQSFVVRFLGSMEVRSDRGEQLVLETIRQIMAARAIHNIFKTTESHFVISSESMRLLDPSNNVARAMFQLQNISYWAVHKENPRLFGFITRTKAADSTSAATFACHVFECNTSGEEICHAINTATKLAFQALMEVQAAKKTQREEEAILLANIQQLADTTIEPQISQDGQFLILDEDLSDAGIESPDTKQPIAEEPIESEA